MGDSQGNVSAQERLIAALGDSLRRACGARSVSLIETHISWVLLAGEYAYKIKKAINLGFLDYSTLEARRFYCDEEVRLNRRTAPDIYLDTIPVGGSPDNPELGVQPAVEYAVRMRRFDTANLMDGLLQNGRIFPSHIDGLAAAITRFHKRLPSVDMNSDFGTAASVKAAALQNCEQLRELLPDEAGHEHIAELEASTEAEFSECGKLFDIRRAQGFVRECHGDLHLGNIVLLQDDPVPFDCIEFNPALRYIDVMDEIAFSVMDLLHREHPELAWRLLNACLEASGDYGGLSVLRFYLAYRAAVRAKVCAIRASQADISGKARAAELAACRSYLALARQSLRQYRPALIITHGLPGSGKTTFSQLVLQQMGAIRIRSDVERKRLYGLGAQENSRSHGDIYGPQATRRTYARLLELAREILLAGFTVIVDAAFLKQDERKAFRTLAQYMSVPFAIASLYADDNKLRERIRQRRNDASEADVAVLDMLQSRQQPLSPRELAFTAEFTTEQSPDSAANARAWIKLQQMLATAQEKT